MILKKIGDIKNSSKIISGILTLMIIGILLFSGPAKAITLGITDISSSGTPNEGSNVYFLAKIDIHTNDIIPLTNVTIFIEHLNGTAIPNANLTFDLNANILSTHTSSLSIELVNAQTNYNPTTAGYGYGYGYNSSSGTYTNINQSFDYGYGYGYGYGYDSFNTAIKSGTSATTAEFIYNVTWTTPSVDSNTEYKVKMYATGDDDNSNSAKYYLKTPATITVQNIGELVTSCGTLNSSDKLYILSQSIGSGAGNDCIIISNESIILDCAGYNITFGNATNGFGVAVADEDNNMTSFDNVTIKNCVLIQNTTGLSEGAIFFGEISNNATVYNNTIITIGPGTTGIYFEGNSSNANISLNNITTSGINGTGIFLSTNGNDANIKSNTIITSANDSSGIKIEDASTNITIYNNTITISGNLNLMDAFGGIFLEQDTSDINVSSNIITTSGINDAGIWIWGSNHSIDSNTITASGEQGDGIYISDDVGTNLTSNTITISGNASYGIYSQMSETSSLIFYNNVITTSANHSDGIHLQGDSTNNISLNNITTLGYDSFGIYFNESHNATLANNIIKTSKSDSYVLYLTTASGNAFYNNIFNTSTSGSGVYWINSDLNYFNTTNSSIGTNIVGKNLTGGNFWTNNLGGGYSDVCTNLDNDYFCDSAYWVINSSNRNIDFIPLATEIGFNFNGTTKDINGNGLNNSLINIAFYDNSFTSAGSNKTYSNATGWFNMRVYKNNSYMYYLTVAHYINNATGTSTSPADWVGQTIPYLPYSEFSSLGTMNFYLRPGGNINITAINSTGDAVSFNYQIKDTKLGFPIWESFSGSGTNATYKAVPRDRNYSIMIYPENGLPVSFDWNNFTADSSYDFNYDSSYDATTYTIQKQFNCTETLEWVSGYINNVTGIEGWDEFTVIPYILEPGDMIYLGDNAGMPYNMSAWRRSGETDNYDLTSGFYNITLPAPAENVTYLLFATARNGTNYYGQYLNVSLNYGGNLTQTNFTHMSGLMNYTGWATANGNITMKNSMGWSNINISSTKQGFNLVNSTNHILSQASAHIEIIVDYSDYGSQEFTFMLDTSQQGSATFYLPLINATGIKEMNIYSMNYAPKRVGTMTPAQIIANPNITMSSFNPGDINTSNDLSDSIYISLYKSNSTCDVPNPPTSCSLKDSSNMDNFKPLTAVIGGGAISFRMGLTSSGIEVHYVNVDMLASGPPSALFDDSATESTSDGFESALRFGSSGPTIYDYVLISMPYNSSKLNESSEVNISIPLFYDDNWNVIWNTSVNGTSGTALSGNDTHYETHASEWETLMGNNTCVVTTTGVSEINSSSPCHIDTTNNKIWLRLPHFSGTGPSVTGSAITTTTSEETTTSPNGGSTTPTTYHPTKEKLAQGYTLTLRKNYNVKFNIGNDSHNLKVDSIENESIQITISSEPQTAILSVGEEKKFELSGDNYYDLSVKLNSITGDNTELTIKTINEQFISQQPGAGEDGTIPSPGDEQSSEEKERENLTWFWILIGGITLLILVGIWYRYFKKSPKKKI